MEAPSSSQTVDTLCCQSKYCSDEVGKVGVQKLFMVFQVCLVSCVCLCIIAHVRQADQKGPGGTLEVSNIYMFTMHMYIYNIHC